MKTVVLLAPYPDEQTIRDGYFQRISNIDDKLPDAHRIYISMCFRRDLRCHVRHLNPRLTVIRLNLFVHFRKLIYLLRQADAIYIPSVGGFAHFLLPLIWSNFKKRNIIFDVHGAFPEETAYKGKKIASKIYAVLEIIIFKGMTTGLFVTEAMKTFYLRKHPFIADKNLVVLPNVARLVSHSSAEDNLEQKLGLINGKVVFIYSGNTQEWQNVPLMLNTIKALRNPRYKFIMLTLRVKEFRNLAEKYGLNDIVVLSISPNELSKYYELAHYGFVLRDQHILNHVACPTKMIEYMHYGILPIVKSANIGDFNTMGYEFIRVEDVNDALLPRKSQKNQAIAARIVAQANSVNLYDFLDESVFK